MSAGRLKLTVVYSPSESSVEQRDRVRQNQGELVTSGIRDPAMFLWTRHDIECGEFAVLLHKHPRNV